MAIERRKILQGLVAGMAWPLLGTPASTSPRELYAAALREAAGGYAAAIFSLDEGIVAKVALPARGHSCLARPGTRECLVFARRPGTFAVAFALDTGKPVRLFFAGPNRHFYGHGAFSPDGRLLYTTENDFANRRGAVGVRDATSGYRPIGEFASGGTGPHDIALLDDGHMLAVANGGIETRPDLGREPLNLDTMRPNLTYIDRRTGGLIERHELPPDLHQVSIRHLAAAGKGRVVFGCQHKGPRNERPNLIGVHTRGEALRLADIPRVANARLKGYVGSICVDGAGEIAAATSPRGGVALYLDVSTGRYLGAARFADASGVTGRKGGYGFVLTSGTGRVARAGLEGLELVSEDGFAWDNHVAAL